MQKKSRNIKEKVKTLSNIVAVFSFIFVLVIIHPHFVQETYANSYSPADEPCDPAYDRSLKAIGWLHGQREITQNQNLIFKPDSVFEYTCFKKLIDVLAMTANCEAGSSLGGEDECPYGEDGTPVELQLFSESERWVSQGSMTGLGGGRGEGISAGFLPSRGQPLNLSLDQTLDVLLRRPQGVWLFNNFGFHDEDPRWYLLLGDRSNREYPTLGQGQDYLQDPPEVIPRPYGCNKMNKVWEEAKCMDFVDVPPDYVAPPGSTFESTDGFYRFMEYRDHPDKRFLPRFMRCRPAEVESGSDQGANRWAINIAEGYESTETTPWEEDTVDVLISEIDPQNCGTIDSKDGKLYTAPIPTGLYVKKLVGAPTEFYEKVCVQPGCHYIPSGINSGECRKPRGIN